MGFFERLNLKAQLDQIIEDSANLRKMFETNDPKAVGFVPNVVAAFEKLPYLYLFGREGLELKEKVRRSFADEVQNLSLSLAQENYWAGAEHVLAPFVRFSPAPAPKMEILGIPLSNDWQTDFIDLLLKADSVPSTRLVSLLSTNASPCHDRLVEGLIKKDDLWKKTDFYLSRDEEWSLPQWLWQNATSAQALGVCEQMKKHEDVLFTSAATNEDVLVMLDNMANFSFAHVTPRMAFCSWFAQFCADPRLQEDVQSYNGIEAFHDAEDFLSEKIKMAPAEQQGAMQKAIDILAQKDQQRVTRLVIEDDAETAAEILCRRAGMAGVEPEIFGGLAWASHAPENRLVLVALPTSGDECLPLRIVGFEPSRQEWENLCLSANVFGFPAEGEEKERTPKALFDEAYARLPAFPEAFATRLAQVKNKPNALTK